MFTSGISTKIYWKVHESKIWLRQPHLRRGQTSYMKIINFNSFKLTIIWISNLLEWNITRKYEMESTKNLLEKWQFYSTYPAELWTINFAVYIFRLGNSFLYLFAILLLFTHWWQIYWHSRLIITTDGIEALPVEDNKGKCMSKIKSRMGRKTILNFKTFEVWIRAPTLTNRLFEFRRFFG